MPIGISEDHREIAEAFGTWAASLDARRAGPGRGGRRRGRLRRGLRGRRARWGCSRSSATSGSLLDLAVAVEACAGALVPGPLLGTAVASVAARRRRGARASPSRSAATWCTARPERPTRSSWTTTASGWSTSAAPTCAPARSPDLSRRASRGAPRGRRAGRRRPGACACAGRRRWPRPRPPGSRRGASTPRSAYAGVREQFGRKIGSFQAIKHLCAEMLETSEVVTAAAWDAARAHDESPEAFELAATVAGVVALDGAVEVAKSCIQVLGGIGFTFEHDAHLYLRRALALRAMLPTSGVLRRPARRTRRRGAPPGAARRARRARRRARRRSAVEAARIAELPEAERRAALAETGLLTPHWPAPYGRGAEPAEQLVVDEELEAAGRAAARPASSGRGRRRRSSATATTPSGSGSSARRCAARSPGASCSASPAPGPTSRPCAPRPSVTSGGWRLTGQKVWTSMAQQADWGDLPGADRSRRRGARGHHLLPRRHDQRRDRRTPAAGDDRGGDVQRGLPRRGLRARRLRGRRGRRRLEAGPHHPGQRAGGDGRLAARASASSRPSTCSRRTRSRASRWAGPSPSPPSSSCSAPAPRCARWPGTGPGRSRAWPSWSASAAARTPPSSSYACSATASSPTTTSLAQALHELLLTRCLSIAGGTTQVLRNVAGERILGLPRTGPSGRAPRLTPGPPARAPTARGGAAASAGRPGSRGGCGSSRRPRRRAGCRGTPRR